MANNTYLACYQKNKELVLNKEKEYYKNNKDRLSKQAGEKYAGLSEEEKDKKKEYRRNKYYTMFGKKKQKK